jgi:PPOX class probable F420-dependent enzyme
MERAEARERLAGARVARLATADRAGSPHLVPICFALAPRRVALPGPSSPIVALPGPSSPIVASPGPSSPVDVVYHAIDHKPKSGRPLRRLANVLARPAVAMLADHYEDEDWTTLWWVRADGRARVLAADDPEAEHAVTLLVARYPQYRERPPAGPVVAVDIERWSGWRGEPT